MANDQRKPAVLHGGSNRGLSPPALAHRRYGRFGRMFAPNPIDAVRTEALVALAKAMIKPDAGAPITEAERADENPAIPAGYTYFGQFVDHDITFDPTPLGAAERDTEAMDDFRSPALDLDSVYGRGPADQPYLYQPGTDQLRTGPAPGNGAAGVGTRHDLFRLNDGTPILGDKRNDENKIVSQLHGAIIALHNKVVQQDALLAPFGSVAGDANSRFPAAVRFVRRHYQWVVLHDYLRRITEPGMVEDVLNNGGVPVLNNYLKQQAEYPYMPVEFAGAAFRFGHSQVRPSYALNLTVIAADGEDPAEKRIPTFSRNKAGKQNLNGFPGTLPQDWGIDWSFFVDGLPKPTATNPALHGAPPVLPQPGYRIDALLTDPLSDLPEFFKETDAAGPAGSPIGNLAFRNLQRGDSLGLPSGEQVARALGIVPMAPDVIWGAGSRLLDESVLEDEEKESLAETRAARADVRARFAGPGGPLSANTPLWFYVLREAEHFGVTHVQDDSAIGLGGQHLGPVGSRIVAETLIGLLWTDTDSILHHPEFRPHPATMQAGKLTLGSLLAFALG